MKPELNKLLLELKQDEMGNIFTSVLLHAQDKESKNTERRFIFH